jgi:hypothetical protein
MKIYYWDGAGFLLYDRLTAAFRLDTSDRSKMHLFPSTYFFLNIAFAIYILTLTGTKYTMAADKNQCKPV